MAVGALFGAMRSLELPAATIEAVAVHFAHRDCVTWSDVRDAGVSGRDVVRLRLWTMVRN